MCNQKATDELRIVLDQPNARSGSAIGLAQAVGQPLGDGDAFELSPAPAGSELLVRLRTGSTVRLQTGQLFERVAAAMFRVPRLKSAQSFEVDVSFADGRVFTSLTLADGTVIAPESIQLPEIYRG